MTITLNDIGKKFSTQWIFRGMNIEFQASSRYALTGPNGSGKSTLLQILSSAIPPSKGKVNYKKGGTDIHADDVYKYLVIAAPYMELIEEFSLKEFLKFHFSFKRVKDGYKVSQLSELFLLEGNENKLIKHFSSGMKQRLKLGIAFYSQADLILLDEPTTNLDREGIDWYDREVRNILAATLVIASNREREYEVCDHEVKITDFN